MKKIKQFVLLAAFVTITSLAFAQNEHSAKKDKTPAWVAQKGFWVIETNVKTPKTSVVHFYTNENQLVYSEKVEGRKLKVKRKKTLVQLKNALDKVMYTWEQNGEVKEQSLLAISK